MSNTAQSVCVARLNLYLQIKKEGNEYITNDPAEISTLVAFAKVAKVVPSLKPENNTLLFPVHGFPMQKYLDFRWKKFTAEKASSNPSSRIRSQGEPGNIPV